jgi:uncharacterized protein YcfJ
MSASMKSNVKSSLFVFGLATLGLVFSSLAQAGDHHRHGHKHHHKHYNHHHHERVVVYERADDYAPVIAARAIYRTVAVDVPMDSCRVETVAYRERRGDSFGGTVVGALVGATIGHELGHGSGHATAAGGLIGASIGNDVATGGRVTRYEDRQVCSTQYRTEYERRLVGYDVSYSYYGRVYHTETDRHPGDSIRVNH